MQPELDLFGLPIKTFGLLFAFAFVVCGAVLGRRLKELGKSEDWAYELVFSALVGGLVGARLYYLAGHTSDFSEDPLGSLFSGSGLVWYGGAAGGALAVVLWARRKGMLNRGLLDLCSVPLAIGYAVGRLGCQVSGDGDYGKPWDGPWAMAYPDGVVPTDVPVHPTPIYEALSMTLLALVLWHLRDRFRPGVLFAFYLVGAGIERFLVEFLRRNEPGLLGLTEAQGLSVAMLLAGLGLLARERRSAKTLALPAI